MGWLFGKKKEPRVPLPEGHLVDERALHFPPPSSMRKTLLEPEKARELVGMKNRSSALASLPELPQLGEEVLPRMEVRERIASERRGQPKREMMLAKPVVSRSRHENPLRDNSLYLNISDYKSVLLRKEQLKSDTLKLQEKNKNLENSEFNEDKNLEKIKRTIKHLHDDLLRIDKILFDPQGD